MPFSPASVPMQNIAQYTDALERALGIVVERARGQLALIEKQAETVAATMSARVAEASARLDAIDAAIAARLASIQTPQDGPAGKDGVDGQDGSDGADGRGVTRLWLDGVTLRAAYTDGSVDALGDIVVPPAEPGPPGESIKGDPGENGRDGTSVTLDDVAPMIEAAVAEAVAKIEPPAGRDGQDGHDADPEDIRRMVAEAVAAIPVPRDGKDADPEMIRAMVDEAVASLPPPAPGKDADPETVRQMVAEAVAAIPVPRDGRDIEPEAVRAMVAEAVAALPPAERGPEGPPGKLPLVRAWEDRVHYEADVVSHAGGTYQALRDTGREPPHEDWICLAAPGPAGERGQDGRSFVVRGTYNAATDYQAFDVVALGGSSFVALRDAPGVCPGDGWQLVASQGGRGRQGDPGPPGPALKALTLDGDGIQTAINADGSTVTCDMYPVLSKLVR